VQTQAPEVQPRFAGAEFNSQIQRNVVVEAQVPTIFRIANGGCWTVLLEN
jgi:hypothetical protein